MSITRLQQARQMYAMGQRVAKTLDGSRPGYAGWNPGVGSPGTTPGGGAKHEGRELGAMANQTQTTSNTTTAPSTTHNPHNDSGSSPTSVATPTTTTTPNFSIHGGPTHTPPTTVLEDEVALTGYGTVPGVDYRYVGPDSQFAKNTYLTNNFPEYSFNSKIPSINFVGNTLGRFAYDMNTNFFKKNSIGGKINPTTGKPFGYGIDGYRDYMKQRQLGNVGAYGGTELSQNAINARAGDGDGGGIMDVTVNETTDDTTDDTNEDGSLILRFLHDNPEEVVNLQAMGVKDTDEMLQVMLDRAKNLYT